MVKILWRNAGSCALGVLALLLSLPLLAQPDTFASFADLSRVYKEGTDFQVQVLERVSPTCVLAIHGGKIEPGTDLLARELAGSDWALYTFAAQLPKNNQVLHITSAHFDDPRALRVAGGAQVCMSFHGFKDDANEKVCVGGGNTVLREKTALALRESYAGWAVESPCKQFGGDDPHNIVNKSRDQGVQLELSGPLRDHLLADAVLRKQFLQTLRASTAQTK